MMLAPLDVFFFLIFWGTKFQIPNIENTAAVLYYELPKQLNTALNWAAEFFFQLVLCDGTDVDKSFIAYTKRAM